MPNCLLSLSLSLDLWTPTFSLYIYMALCNSFPLITLLSPHFFSLFSLSHQKSAPSFVPLSISLFPRTVVAETKVQIHRNCPGHGRRLGSASCGQRLCLHRHLLHHHRQQQQQQQQQRFFSGKFSSKLLLFCFWWRTRRPAFLISRSFWRKKCFWGIAWALQALLPQIRASLSTSLAHLAHLALLFPFLSRCIQSPNTKTAATSAAAA